MHDQNLLNAWTRRHGYSIAAKGHVLACMHSCRLMFVDLVLRRSRRNAPRAGKDVMLVSVFFPGLWTEVCAYMQQVLQCKFHLLLSHAHMALIGCVKTGQGDMQHADAVLPTVHGCMRG